MQKKMEPKIRILIQFILSAVVLAFLARLAVDYLYRNYKPMTFTAAKLEESSKPVQNPYHGFYHLYGFELSNEDPSKARALAKTITDNKDFSLVLLEINLKQFRNENLPQNALTQLDVLLSACQEKNKKLILRFLYDWDGKAKETEPDQLSQITTHMSQVANTVNAHKDAVYVLQGIFVGNCGEMNNSRYMSNNNMTTLIKHLHKVMDKSIFLSVRTPAHYRTISGTRNPLPYDAAFSGTLASRVGLFNDGMLGSDIDLGTYGTSSINGKKEIDAKGTRAEEIEFQSNLCQYVPNGGECVVNNPYNNFENAIQDLADMHVSYLNYDYDKAVLNKWKSATYKGDGVFQNVNGLDYVKAHLGYRYVVTKVTLDYTRFMQKEGTLNITVANTGFAPCYKQFFSTLLLVPKKLKETPMPSETVELPLELDNRTIPSQEELTIQVSIDPMELENGGYEILLVMRDDTSYPSQNIRFANTNLTDKGYVSLGTLVNGQ